MKESLDADSYSKRSGSTYLAPNAAGLEQVVGRDQVCAEDEILVVKLSKVTWRGCISHLRSSSDLERVVRQTGLRDYWAGSCEPLENDRLSSLIA
jgi:hypothetical protein